MKTNYHTSTTCELDIQNTSLNCDAHPGPCRSLTFNKMYSVSVVQIVLTVSILFGFLKTQYKPLVVSPCKIKW